MKLIFIISSVFSIISLAFAGLLLGIYFTEESAGMIMIFLLPLLVFGLVTGIASLLMKKFKNLELNQFLNWIHYLNLLLIPLGLIAFIYTLNS